MSDKQINRCVVTVAYWLTIGTLLAVATASPVPRENKTAELGDLLPTPTQTPSPLPREIRLGGGHITINKELPDEVWLVWKDKDGNLHMEKFTKPYRIINE
jgi:hypothetical protein